MIIYANQQFCPLVSERKTFKDFAFGVPWQPEVLHFHRKNICILIEKKKKKKKKQSHHQWEHHLLTEDFSFSSFGRGS